MSVALSHHRASSGLGEAPRACPTRSRLLETRARARSPASSGLAVASSDPAGGATGWWAYCAVARAEAGSTGARD